MRHLLALFALAALLVACDDSSTGSNGAAAGTLFRWHMCSDTLTRNLERRMVLSDGRSITIPKGDTCTTFTADTNTSMVKIEGNLSWNAFVYSGTRYAFGMGEKNDTSFENKTGKQLASKSSTDTFYLYGDTAFSFDLAMSGMSLQLKAYSVLEVLEPAN